MALRKIEKCKICGEMGCSKHISKSLNGHDAFEINKAFNPLTPLRTLGGMAAKKTSMTGAKSFASGISKPLGSKIGRAQTTLGAAAIKAGSGMAAKPGLTGGAILGVSALGAASLKPKKQL